MATASLTVRSDKRPRAGVACILCLSLASVVARADGGSMCPLQPSISADSLCTDASGQVVQVMATFSNIKDADALALFLEHKLRNDAANPVGNHAINPVFQQLKSLRNVLVLSVKIDGRPEEAIEETRRRLDVHMRDYANSSNDPRESGRADFRVDAHRPIVVTVEPSLRLVAREGSRPDDPKYQSMAVTYGDYWPQWNLKDAGAETMWRRLGTLSGLAPVIVAVADTGVERSPDPASMINAELPDSSMAPMGGDFVTHATEQTDTEGHGTEVASIIAATTNNGKGMAGATWNGGPDGRPIARIMPVRVMVTAGSTPSLQQCTHVLLDGLPFAADPHAETGTLLRDLTVPDTGGVLPAPKDGASVINLSAGFKECSPAIGELLRRMQKHLPNVLLVAAASNDPQNADTNADYPASYELQNLLVVTSIESSGHCIHGGYGQKNVDLAAGGENVVGMGLSGTINDALEGSSFAAPLVSSAAAVLRSLAPTWGYKETIDYLKSSVAHGSSGCGSGSRFANSSNLSSGGYLDFAAATGAPVTILKPGADSTSEAGKKVEIKWKTLFNQNECPKLTTSLRVVGRADPVLLPFVLTVGDKGLKDKTVTLDAHLFDVIGGDSPVKARLQVNCEGTRLFALSEEFTIKPASH